MSRSPKPRKAYRPRLIAVNTLEIALHRAAKPAAADREEVLNMLRQAAQALREGVATELQWSIIAGAVDVAKAIEHQGIVRGLAEHLASAEASLQTIYDRAIATGTWKPTALHYYELDAVQTFVDLHTFQVNQLGRAEFLAAVDTAQARINASGNKAALVRDLQTLQAA
ncbi:MAG: hypothetical protein CK604_00710 [Curvibacter sp. PD_MW3]|nr:MAG: hypothetical protein CK604_00710 [Curvibacter sp. PD_MW3]